MLACCCAVAFPRHASVSNHTRTVPRHKHASRHAPSLTRARTQKTVMILVVQPTVNSFRRGRQSCGSGWRACVLAAAITLVKVLMGSTVGSHLLSCAFDRPTMEPAGGRGGLPSSNGGAPSCQRIPRRVPSETVTAPSTHRQIPAKCAAWVSATWIQTPMENARWGTSPCPHCAPSLEPPVAAQGGSQS